MGDVTYHEVVTWPCHRPGSRREDEPREDALQAGRATLVNKNVGTSANTHLGEEQVNGFYDSYIIFPILLIESVALWGDYHKLCWHKQEGLDLDILMGNFSDFLISRIFKLYQLIVWWAISFIHDQGHYYWTHLRYDNFEAEHLTELDCCADLALVLTLVTGHHLTDPEQLHEQ